MKFIKFLAVAVFALAGALGANAQTAKEVKATETKMMAAATPCNQGPEAFKQFIQKFNTDQTFLDSRLKITDAQKEEYAAILHPGNFEAKVPFAKDGDEFYQSWGELQFAKAYLDCGWVDSYVAYTFEFIRVNGKWYLGKIVPGE